MAAEVAGQVEARLRPGGGGSELKQAGWKVLQCPGWLESQLDVVSLSDRRRIWDISCLAVWILEPGWDLLQCP